MAGGLGEVLDCQPCRLDVTADVVLGLRFQREVLPDGTQALRGVTVSDTSGRALQVLSIEDMDPIESGGSFMIQAQDLDFDGYRDLMLLTRRGGANAYALYWRYDPAPGRLVALGEHAVLAVDPGRRRLSSYERGGHAGRIYAAREYVLRGGELIVTAEEVQRFEPDANVYRRVRRERADGELREVAEEVVPAE